MTFSTIDAENLALALTDGGEIAFLDVREEGEHGQSHPILAVNLPLGRLEIMVRDLLPGAASRIVIADDNGAADGEADRAAERLGAMGYGNVTVLEDGFAAWGAAGLELYSGVNVLSKTFGEWVELEFATPSLSADEVKAKLDAGADLVILDSRPWGEYRNMSIPSGINVPGGELVLRVADLAPDPETLVVVNCAGRTRSILGTQSLVNAGLINPVAALRNGTMGWQLAGHELEFAAGRRYGEVSGPALAWSRAAAARVAERFAVASVDAATIEAWRTDRDRTLYLLDVRSPEEYLAGHLAGSRPAPGGQLVQATDHYLATRNARVVLLDDDGVRARLTASWLKQLGWADSFVLQDGLPDGLESGPHVPDVALPGGVEPVLISAGELAGRIAENGLTVIDVGSSQAYAKGHVPGAWWLSRARLGTSFERLPPTDTYVVSAGEPALAALAAHEIAALGGVPAMVLEGGSTAWHQAGLALEEGATRLTSEPVDVYYRPYEHGAAPADAMQGYLDWELALPGKLARDKTLSFPRVAG